VGRLIPAGTGLAYHTARKRLKMLGPEAAAAAEAAFAPADEAAPAAPETAADAA